MFFWESFGECGEDIALSIDFFDRYKTFPVIPKTVVATLRDLLDQKKAHRGLPKKMLFLVT